MPLERPRIAVRVGITGHRNLTGAISVRQSLTRALNTIRTATESIRNASCAAWSDETTLFRAISPLAEGADRLFAQEALGLGFELDCPLPFAQPEYEKDFA